jgi:hypothetical protein
LQTDLFFNSDKRLVTLTDVKPKLNTEKEKRIRFDFQMPLTAEALQVAPKPVTEAFYAVAKDGGGMVGAVLAQEIEGLTVRFFSTGKTLAAALTLTGCTIRQLEVTRPEKGEINEGDIQLGFHMNIPASREAWDWAYRHYGNDVFLACEETQPSLPGVGEPTAVVDMKARAAVDDSFPDMPAENRLDVDLIEPTKGKKK